MTDDEDSIEQRVEELEEKVESIRLVDLIADENVQARLSQREQDIESVSVADLEERMASLQEQQAEIQRAISTLAEHTRKQGDETPHIDSVRYLYLSLQDIETYMSEVRRELKKLHDGEGDDQLERSRRETSEN